MQIKLLKKRENKLAVENPITKKAGEFAQKIGYSRQELIIVIENMLKMKEHEGKLSKIILQSFFGMFVKLNNNDKIQIDGTKLMQLFQFAKKTPPIKLSPLAIYQVDVLMLKELLDMAKKTSPEK